MSILEISHLSVTLAFIAYTVIQSKWDKLTHERLEELTQRSNVLTRIVDTLCMQYDQVVVRKAAEEAVKWDVGDEMKTIVVPIVGGNGE